MDFKYLSLLKVSKQILDYRNLVFCYMNNSIFGYPLTITAIPTFFMLLLFYVHGKQLRSYRDGQLILPHFSLEGLVLPGG